MSKDRQVVRIEKLVAGGEGLARLEDGAACFVEGAVPGESVELLLTERKKSFARGKVVRVLEPAPTRREPPCPWAEACGGCPWMHLAPAAQRKWKEEILREALRRTGGLDWTGPIPMHASGETGHRDRIRWKVHGRGREIRIGFHASGSRELVEVGTCLLPRREGARFLPALREALDADPTALGQLREIVQDLHPEGDLFTLRFRKRPPRRGPAAFAEALRGALDPPPRGVLSLVKGRREPEVVSGEGFVEREAGEFVHRVHGGAFFQTNAELRDELLRRVLELAEGGEGLCLELYSGVGFLTLPLARQFGRLLAVESGTAAVRQAEAAAARHGISNVGFVRSDVAAWTAEAESEPPEVVVSDPPRTGHGLETARRLAGLGQRRTVLVACDPVSLARDLGPFLEAGHTLEVLEIFDFFPGSHHLEAVALLTGPA